MGAVTGSLEQVFTGRAAPRVEESVRGYVGAFSFIQGFPSSLPAAGWMLLVAAVGTAIRYRRDSTMLAVVLLPQALAIIGYALFQGGLDHYYYLSLMPAAVLTIVLAITALPDRWLLARNAIAALALAGSLTQLPGRFAFSATLHKMPEYAPLVEGSRRAVRQRQPMRAIETEFTLPAPSDRTFVYRILGGRIDPASPWIARIRSTGDVDYQKVE
jgi:4-amino-4-deoxy-L-arabinose transferase-like glycosyltransferase